VFIAVPQEVLNVIREENLIDNAKRTGAQLASGIREITAGDSRFVERLLTELDIVVRE
jgi:4-aminobutyrate aminotransferase-like enzyme